MATISQSDPAGQLTHERSSVWDSVRPVVLVADPEPGSYAGLLSLCERSGSNVHTVETGTDALILFGRLDPALVVVSDTVEGVPWQDVVAAVRKHAAVPVLVVTDEREGRPPLPVLRPGIDELVSRHYLVDGTPSVVARFLERIPTHESRERILRAGNITMDVAAFEVKAGDRAVVLTLREFEVLRVFMLHAGETLSREELRELVWKDLPPSANDSTIKVMVGRLRRNLAPEATILAVRGVGYRLVTH